MVKILFVCTGNMFRSLSCEYVLKKFIEDNKANLNSLCGFSYSQFHISSAGTGVRPQLLHKKMISYFKTKGIDIFHHMYMQIDRQLVDEFDLIVALGKDHKKYIKKHFNLDVPLFNEICYNKQEDIFDDWEVLGWENIKDGTLKEDDYIKSVIDYIFDSMPYFVKNFRNYIG